MSDSPSTFPVRTVGLIAGVCAVAIVAIGIGTRYRNEHQLATWTDAQATTVVAVVKPQAIQGGQSLTLPGDLRALNNAPIYPRTNGYVRKWLVDIGDPVRAGQVLGIIDAPEVDQQVSAARADLQTARANQALAKSTAARWSTMLAKDAVSRQEADEKAGDLAAKTAITNAASANLLRLQATQGFTRLVAPFSGVVTTRAAEVGQLVNAGSAGTPPLFTVADVSRMRIYVRVPQSYSAQVHQGMHAALTLPEYPGRKFDATLTRLAGAVDPQSGTMLVELQAPNGDRALKPGAYSQVIFPLAGLSTSVTVPASALIVGADGTKVAVIGPDGKAQLRTVRVGRDMGNTVEVTAGVTTADRVINSPPNSLQTGDVVHVAGDTKGAADAHS
ncbi:efflux RND transporter periplasmic adaptor subunit [Sphingomonas sp. MMS24-J13]|uniref:efflux RND transporter periplasmic adaptor subunit n=1 Tax=Sphingomonas sp. MMS24-J13 TaxID=3238686 RepID=UPI00384FD642